MKQYLRSSHGLDTCGTLAPQHRPELRCQPGALLWPQRFLLMCMLQACVTPSASPESATTTGSASSTTSTGSVSPSTTGGGTTGGANPVVKVSSFCPAGPFGSPVPTNAVPNPLAAPAADHFDGPVWVNTYLLYSAWNNQPDDGNGPLTAIMKMTPPATFAVASAAGALRTNGLSVDANGWVYAAVHGERNVSRFTQLDAQHRQVLAATFDGKAFNSPNDVAVRSDGNVYFTDPDYQADGRATQSKTRVYRIDSTGVATVVDEQRNEPNGIVLSLDETWLYVGGNDNKIQRYAVAADGSTGPAQDFIATDGNVDGMGMDCAGNLYASIYPHNKIMIYSAQGTALGQINTPENVTNLSFGDSQHQTLYITTVTHLYSLAMPIAGLP